MLFVLLVIYSESVRKCTQCYTYIRMDNNRKAFCKIDIYLVGVCGACDVDLLFAVGDYYY